MPLTAGRWFKLDRNYNVLDADPGAPVTIREAIGRNLWDVFEGTKTPFRPVYEKAWETGHSARLVYWNHVLTDIQARVVDGTLVVYFSYVTVAGLEEALQALMDDSCESNPALPAPPPKRRRLRKGSSVSSALLLPR